MNKIYMPIKLSFTDLTYTVRTKSTKSFSSCLSSKCAKHHDEVILKGVSGYMLPGQTHYIMGASGAGKTTLLNALSGRIKQDTHCRLKGDLTLNDKVPLNTATFANYGAYVMQDDSLFEYFTVRESL